MVKTAGLEKAIMIGSTVWLTGTIQEMDGENCKLLVPGHEDPFFCILDTEEVKTKALYCYVYKRARPIAMHGTFVPTTNDNMAIKVDIAV